MYACLSTNVSSRFGFNWLFDAIKMGWNDLHPLIAAVHTVDPHDGSVQYFSLISANAKKWRRAIHYTQSTV